MTLPKGGRLFTALVDLKITLAFLFIDSIRATPDGNSINRKDDINILSNPVLFKTIASSKTRFETEPMMAAEEMERYNNRRK